ncbi:hypothetical protein NCAS_0G03120 [Naumovozyma castellii]|uniref:Protein transport protein SEC24-1 n=1 Tax=Naumovozyma castellii TaxID=27288 RepID=SC241_NAUCA|nr:hypothetical protein NCAS_0G03120 [Naumovozyma castellii CBS 4309]Q875V8.1 RecName: Full=Protein transport protein SEC24-1 [Naumovozyma castellii CBS 4309]AAO32524.1 SEC24 [Naumovozyma castellii]CCC71199.1 hypothetical protein NCAS_0G03120 [Naumovozyma castellii CBS 4309]
MSHKKRVYPTAQLQYGQTNIYEQHGVPQDAGAPQGQPLQSDIPYMNAQPGVIPGQGAPMMMDNGAMPQQQMFTPAQQQLNQQIDQTTAAMGNMQFNPAANESNMYYQQPLPQQQQQQQQQQGPAKPPKPMNQLYPIDLLVAFPPPISDLSLPPPPILFPLDTIPVPSEDALAPSNYIRSTLNAVPKSNSLLKKTKLPFSLVITPYQHLHDDINPPPLNEDGTIVRCRRCRSYMNPFVHFNQDGRRWKCNICNLFNEVPSFLDRMPNDTMSNRYMRNELRYSVVEYLAPKEYSLRQPPPSTYTFIIDVSQNAMKNGLLGTTTRTLLDNLDSLPNHDGRTRISILCVDNGLHYFAIPSDDQEGQQVEMMDVCDLDDAFIPRPDSMVVNLVQCRNNIETLLTKIPQIFQNNIINKFALGPALQAAYNLTRNEGGKIIVVSATLPNIGVGQLKKRVEEANVGTPKESQQLLTCQDPFYKTFTIQCNKVQISIDMFLASEEYMDVATLANLGHFSGGQTHFYPGFSAQRITDATKFSMEFAKHLSMDTSNEVVMRARGSTGIRTTGFHGHFFNRSSDLCAFSIMNRDQSYVFDITLDENIAAEYCYVQVAILLSLNTSQRRIRVITLALPTTDSIAEVYASVDQLAVTAAFTQKAIDKAQDTSLEEARRFINQSVEDVLTTYKKELVVQNTGAGGMPLRLCANMKIFPLLMHALTKNLAFRPGRVPSDHRAAALNYMESVPLKYLLKCIYPTIYSLHDMPDEVGLPDENNEIILPEPINASYSSFETYGLYLIDNGIDLFLWMGGEALPQLVEDAFGVPNILEMPIGKQEVPVVPESPFNERIRNIINRLRNHDDVITYQSLYILRSASNSDPVQANAKELSSLRMWASTHLVEDKIMGSEGYRDFLQMMKNKTSK